VNVEILCYFLEVFPFCTDVVCMAFFLQVQDSFPFPIALSWKGSAPESDGGEEASPNSIVFVKGNPIPSTKMLTFYRSGTFSIDVLYVDTSELPPLTAPKISTFTIGPFTPSKGEKAKLKVKIRLNLHGIVSVESATVSGFSHIWNSCEVL
jgi:heat shock protein 4